MCRKKTPYGKSPQAGSPARVHSGDPGVREFPYEKISVSDRRAVKPKTHDTTYASAYDGETVESIGVTGHYD